MTEYALLASWDSKWIKDHKDWLSSYGSHSDGWSNKIKEDNIDLLKSTEQVKGFLWFYAYMPKSKGGDMKVNHRIKIKNLTYSKELHPFTHVTDSTKLTHSDTASNYQARLTFQIIDIEDIPPLDPTGFITSKGENVTGSSQLLNILIVEQNG